MQINDGCHCETEIIAMSTVRKQLLHACTVVASSVRKHRSGDKTVLSLSGCKLNGSADAQVVSAQPISPFERLQWSGAVR